MSYITPADVSALAPQVTFSATSRPSETHLEDVIIPDITHEVEAILRGIGIVTPVDQTTSPVAYARVQQIIAWGALGQALASRALAAGNPDDHGAGWAMKEYQRRLKALQQSDDPDALVDAVTTGEAVVKANSELHGSHASDGLAGEPTVTRDQVF